MHQHQYQRLMLGDAAGKRYVSIYLFLTFRTRRQMETNRLVFQVSPSPPLVASHTPPQIPDQQPRVNVEASCLAAVSCGSEQKRGGRKYERNKDGCLSSRGRHDTLITSRSPPSHPSSPDAQKQPGRNHYLFLQFAFSSHPSPSSFSPFSSPSPQPSTLLSAVSVLTLCVCHSAPFTLSLCPSVDSVETNSTSWTHGICFPAKV